MYRNGTMMLTAEKRVWVVECKLDTYVEWYNQATCRCQGLDLERKCTHCRMVGLEEDTCFKEKAKEGGRQRGSVCYNHAIADLGQFFG